MILKAAKQRGHVAHAFIVHTGTVTFHAPVLPLACLSFTTTWTSPAFTRRPGDMRPTTLSCQQASVGTCMSSAVQYLRESFHFISGFGARQSKECKPVSFRAPTCFAEHATSCDGPKSLASPSLRTSSLSYCQGTAALERFLLCSPTGLLGLPPKRSTSEHHLRSAKSRLVALLRLRASLTA